MAAKKTKLVAAATNAFLLNSSRYPSSGIGRMYVQQRPPKETMNNRAMKSRLVGTFQIPLNSRKSTTEIIQTATNMSCQLNLA